jgi:hypothetical protein
MISQQEQHKSKNCAGQPKSGSGLAHYKTLARHR